MLEPQESTANWVSNLSWVEVESKIQRGDCALLPIGAAAKEHGLHLPMNTDYLQAQWIAEQLGCRTQMLIWPVVSYGYYPAFVDYPGSITISQDTFSLMIEDIARSIINAGVTRLALLNTGISTIKPLELTVSKLPENVHLINVYNGPQFKQVCINVIEQSAGGHADEVETSIMLAIDQALVDMSKASGSMQACAQPGILSRCDSQSLNYTPTGACGAPQFASPEKGRLLLNAMLADIHAQLAEFGFSRR